jgi:Glycosyl hydrolases family 32 N-terminal domain
MKAAIPWLPIPQLICCTLAWVLISRAATFAAAEDLQYRGSHATDGAPQSGPSAKVRVDEPAASTEIDRETLDRWSAPYRGWHYQAEHVIPAQPSIPGHQEFNSTDVPCVYQLPGQPDKWLMSFIAFNGQGYNSFVAESTDLVRWTNPRLAMGFGGEGEFDYGGCVIGAFLYQSYDIKAARLLKRRNGKYWTIYGCYPRQGGYELRPGYEGVAASDDGLTWQRAKDHPILAVHDSDCGTWEKDCIYQPWLVEQGGQFFDFYNAANGGKEQTGLAFSDDLLHWKRYPANPVIRNRPGGYDEQFASDPKVFRDGDHWTMFYFGVGHGGAHIMAAFSDDLLHWTAHPEPLYKASGNPSGLDQQYAHKISLVYNPRNKTFYLYYCACGNKGRGIGLITSKPI